MSGEKGIREAMGRKGVTVDAVAAVLGVHRNSASNKVNGATAFTVDEALTLRRNLFPEYTMEYLFGGGSGKEASEVRATKDEIRASAQSEKGGEKA